MASEVPKALHDSAMRMAPETTLRSVHLSEQRINEILDHLDNAEPQGGRGVDARRRVERHPFRQLDALMVVLHPGGGLARFLVPTRDISANGLSILHGGYLHAGTDCKIELPALWGDKATVEGAIVRCEHLVGPLHQIAIHFYAPVDINKFVDTGSDEAPAALDPVEAPDVAGRILLVDDQAFEARLLAYHLRCSSVELMHAQTVDKALQILRKESVDLVICDMNLAGQDGEQAIRAIRSQGYKGYIIALSGEWSRRRLTAARDAGAAAILPKPYDPTKLLQNIASFLKAGGSAGDDSPLYSKLKRDEETRDLLRKFVLDTRRLAEQLSELIDREDLAGARQLAVTLKEAGGGYGFPDLYDAASSAITALDASYSVAESMQEIRKVHRLCTRLRTWE